MSAGTYSRIRRGPMAADQFTQIRNALFRDKRMSFKAKGIFGLISTHTDGYGITPERIADYSTDGTSAVRTGLQELEKGGYLQREQPRRTNGTMGPIEYYITDMPSSEPVTENREAAATCDDAQNRRSEPVNENPQAAEPQAADRTPKNTSTKNTTEKKTKKNERRSSRRSRTTSGSRSGEADSSPKGSGERATREDHPSPDDTPPHDQTQVTWSRDAYTVLSELRGVVASLPPAVQQGLGYVVDDTLTQEGVSVDQLAYRARTALAGTSPALITDPTGWIRGHALKPRGCADPDCEAGMLYSAGAPCRSCLETHAYAGAEKTGARA